MATTAEQVLVSLKRVIEPEYGINVVDLGLIYGITVDGRNVEIEMTFPQAQGENRAETERRIRERVLRRHPDLEAVAMVFAPEPEWREDFITAEGELQRQSPLSHSDLDVDLTVDDVWDSLRLVPDPEVGISIVDLGLVYDVAIARGDVTVTMTLTTPGCPLHASIEEAVQRIIETRHPDVGEIVVNLVWEPAWDTEMISAFGREQLGWR